MNAACQCQTQKNQTTRGANQPRNGEQTYSRDPADIVQLSDENDEVRPELVSESLDLGALAHEIKLVARTRAPLFVRQLYRQTQTRWGVRSKGPGGGGGELVPMCGKSTCRV